MKVKMNLAKPRAQKLEGERLSIYFLHYLCLPSCSLEWACKWKVTGCEQKQAVEEANRTAPHLARYICVLYIYIYKMWQWCNA